MKDKESVYLLGGAGHAKVVLAALLQGRYDVALGREEPAEVACGGGGNGKMRRKVEAKKELALASEA